MAESRRKKYGRIPRNEPQVGEDGKIGIPIKYAEQETKAIEDPDRYVIKCGEPKMIETGVTYKIKYPEPKMIENPVTIQFKYEEKETKAIENLVRYELINIEPKMIENPVRYVLKYPEPSINVTEFARDVAQGIIEERQDDPRFRWKGHDQVTVISTKVLPVAGLRATQDGRRTRLWKALEEILEPQGWKHATRGMFVRQT